MVLEIDTPGHTAIVAASHPEFVACYEKEPWGRYAHQPPAGQLRFASDEVVDLAKDVFEEVAGLTQSRYIGTGGDELNLNCMVSWLQMSTGES